MADPVPIDEVVRRYLDRLDRRWVRAVRDLVEAHRTTLGPIRRTLEALERDIALAVAQEVEVSASWLYQRDRYRSLEAQTRAAINRTAAQVAEVVPVLRQQGIEAGVAYADDILTAANPAMVAGGFGRLPLGAIEAQVGMLQSRGLRDLGRSIDPDRGWLMLRDRLVSGLARGTGVRGLAREMTQAISGLTLTRAMTISRTEMLRSYRAAASTRWSRLETVTAWVWRAAVADSQRPPCAVCFAQHGEVFPKELFMATHPNCRCVMVPTVIYQVVHPSLEPGVGEARLRALPERTQVQILGRTRQAAFARGDLDLKDMVEMRFDPTWGNQPRLRRLRDLPLGVLAGA